MSQSLTRGHARASRQRRSYGLLAMVLAMVCAVTAVPAGAATGDIGYQGPSFTGVSSPPTSDKPQSKLWYNDGRWWATMFDSASKNWHIFRLERSTQTWVDTGTMVDNRPQTLSDALWDGKKLYVASQWVTTSSEGSPRASLADRPARLYRYSYSSTTKTYTLDPGFPANINNQSSESLSIDKDTTGKLWATWTQVSGSSTSGYTSQVYVNSTQGSDATWGTPMVVPTAGSDVTPDDISAVVAFARNRIGVLWSNQLDGTVYWAVHTDGDAEGSWRGSVAIRGPNESDDHINVKTLQSDQAGRVYAAVKTNLDNAGSSPSSAQIKLLVFKPGTGAWSSSVVGTLAECHTRPIVMLDEENSRVHVLATAPTSSGCAYSGLPGTIYEKVAPMDDPVFPTGRGTPVIRDAASENMNNATSTKQGVNSGSGLVVLASNTSTARYWHADLALPAKPAAPKAPKASFTASTTSGTAPLPVQFTDTSSGDPTSWAWDFGNGTTSTEQNPSVTYRAAGTYTVTMTASNAAGTSAPVTTTVTVSPPPESAAINRASTSTSFETKATTGLTIQRPSGTTQGDLLVSCVAMASGRVATNGVPQGWTAIASVTESGKPILYGYYKVAGPSEPMSYQWNFSAAVTSGGGIARYTGAGGLDVPESKAVGNGVTGTVPGLRTESDGAMLVGCMGVNSASSSLSITQPAGMSQAWFTGGSNHQFADETVARAGLTGDRTWRFASKTKWAGWLAALRPA
jgi:hypothetical protein